MTSLKHRACNVKSRQLLTTFAALLAVGCSTVPAAGPTGGSVRSQIDDQTAAMAIDLVPVQSMADLPSADPRTKVFVQEYAPPPPTELVGPGDEIDVTIYETGISLFGGGSVAAAGAGPAAMQPQLAVPPSSSARQFPPFRVSDDGRINFPFIGEIAVAGRTTDQVEAIIEQGLRGKSQNPQVLVSLSRELTNSVIIGGDVRNPGRLVLPTNQESLSDVVALAGGSSGELKDVLVRIQREGDYGEFRLSDILSAPEQDIRIYPADRILLVRAPQTFSALGSAGRAAQFEFPAPSVSLAEAIALAGGSNPNSGDPSAIFVFRIIEGEDGREQPTVFHFNMLDASSYILAQRFEMRDKDVLYVGEAEANRPSKVIQVLSQLFFPLTTLQNTLNNN